MVDTGTWNRLDDGARQEFRDLFQRFQESLRDAGVMTDTTSAWSGRFKS